MRIAKDLDDLDVSAFEAEWNVAASGDVSPPRSRRRIVVPIVIGVAATVAAAVAGYPLIAVIAVVGLIVVLTVVNAF